MAGLINLYYMRSVIERDSGIQVIYNNVKRKDIPKVTTRTKISYKNPPGRSTIRTYSMPKKPIFTTLMPINGAKSLDINEPIDIQVYGIKRSGHHAIVYWILGHYAAFNYYNNCQVVRKKLVAQDFFAADPGIRNPINIASFEDRQDGLKRSSIINLGARLRQPNIARVLVIRDPFNNYASRFKLGKEFTPIYKQTGMWKESAREYLGITNYLGKNLIKINYNEWCRNISYRKELSKNFGIFTDKNFDYIPKIGGGSSFDKRRYDGRSEEMNTLFRWRKYINDPHYIEAIINDKELMDLSTKIFGNIFKI